MADQTGRPGDFLAPPRLAAIRNEDVSARVRMERSVSQEIREERQDLKEAAEQSLNVIVDLGLDGRVRWVSPSWREVVGTPADTVVGKPVADVLLQDGEANPFLEAIETMRQDDSKSQIIRFRIKLGPESQFTKDSAILAAQREAEGFRQDEFEDEEEGSIITLEGQGIMVYDRTTGEMSNTMWMLRPATVPREITIDLPEVLVESLGFGAEVLANHLTALAEAGSDDPENFPPPMPILCRICERQIVPWWFEKHSDLCLQEHQAESEVQSAHEALADHRNAIVKVLDALEARKTRPTSTEPAPSPVPAPEYKGLPIGPGSPSSSSSSVSGRASPATPPRSRDTSNAGFGHSRARSFAVRRPLARIVELVLDLCDTALEIKTPSLSGQGPDGEFRTQSPGSESRVSQVLNWQTPGSNTLESEEGLAALATDTETMAREKVQATLRHRRILEYSERIRIEFHVLVQDCIEAAMRKAQNIREGKLSDSSETESDAETPAPSTTNFFPNSLPEHPEKSPSAAGAMASALQHATQSSYDPTSERRRSVAISTGSNSPMECPTPRSHSRAGILKRGPSVSKRSSLYAGSDGGESDGSGSLSSSVLSANKRIESPSQEFSLGRSQSSRNRKRRSLKLSSGISASPRRQSPNRGTQPPASPLRLSKPRIPSAADFGNTPISSPMLPSLDPGSPVDLRRQSINITSGDISRAPPSPRLAALNQPQQQKAVPPSIKDFEIIKPISKGAFGSVYLSKKKATGDYFAIKVLKKSDMVAKNQVTNVKAERAIMMWQGESDFVAKLYWTFSSKDYLYLVMEYLNGGDCASLIKVLGGLQEDWAKKYLAEVVLGVQHLHNRGIVHRDLKPDNLLIDQKGHLKLTDFGLSRMGLIGRQKRLAKSPHNSVPDLLKSGPFVRPFSKNSSRSTSFDFQGQQSQSPTGTPVMTPDMAPPHGQPSYFSLGRENVLSREHSRRASGYRSDSGSSETFNAMFKNFSLEDSTHRDPPIEEERDEDSGSPDPYVLSHSISQNSGFVGTPPQTSMPPPALALFDPEDQNRRFVGTPDYLAPETINGFGQDESSDWWSIGCILFEFLYGYPPFHAETPEEVFENILARRIAWPTEEECYVSEEARDLMEHLMTVNTKDRLGSNVSEKFANGGDEIRAHPWFGNLNWDTLLEDDAQFVPQPENPEDTEYFDSRGATLQAFAEELEDQASSPAPTPGADYPERPHDALSGLRRQFNSMKRNLMPLHIPAHVRETRSRRLSEPVANDDFGTFAFKNLPVLEKANKDVIQKLRAEALKEGGSKGANQSSLERSHSQAPSVEGSPLLPSPLKRTLSHKNRAASPSPSNLGSAPVSASPNKVSHPTSPLLVQFSTGQNHERRKTSSTSSASHQSGASLQPGNFFEPPKLPSSLSAGASMTSSPVRPGKPIMPASAVLSPPEKGLSLPRPISVSGSRTRSQTVGSQEDIPLSAGSYTHHHKRRSQVFDISPQSSDNEDTRAKALLRVQRRRQSSRRMSQFSINEGPCFRPLDVLICEDHPVSRMVMERLLEKLRCRTITVGNGPDAVRFATSEVQFDIIMMEVKLPQLSGNDVARMIRSTKNANQATPIVAVTGYLKELPQTHHFNALIDKPPTKEKLTEVLCSLCQWKAPPADWQPGPLQHVPSSLRQESNATEDSPSSQSSGPFAQVPGASYRASSREDSITSSSFFGDMDASDAGGGVIINQTDDWPPHGLGIGTEDSIDPKSFSHPGLPHLLHYNSAPPVLDVTMPSPRKAPSSEAIRAKREIHAQNRHECAESGDDEDEELGDALVQPKSPRRGSKRPSVSKLGSQMLRTNSTGSVISGSEETPPPHATLPPTSQPYQDQDHPMSAVTPPEMFARAPGHAVKEIEMDDVDGMEDVEATPRPTVSGHAHPEASIPITPTGKHRRPSPDEEATPRVYGPRR